MFHVLNNNSYTTTHLYHLLIIHIIGSWDNNLVPFVYQCKFHVRARI